MAAGLKIYGISRSSAFKTIWCGEEAGVAYEQMKIGFADGTNKTPEFLAIHPNGRVPAIVDGDAVVFDSNAILLYLAEKTGKFLPAKSDKLRGEMLSWLMFVASGVGPFSGQSVHFRHYAPKDGSDYAVNRYVFEVQRHYGVLDARLAGRQYMVGDSYTIVDMDTDPFTFDRSARPQMELLEPESFALDDFSGLSYTEAFDAMVAKMRNEYAFTEYKGLDWDALIAEFRPRFEEAEANGDSTGYRRALRDFTWACLLYTSDAADDLLCVDLGGRRIIKKKKQQIKKLRRYRNSK